MGEAGGLKLPSVRKWKRLRGRVPLAWHMTAKRTLEVKTTRKKLAVYIRHKRGVLYGMIRTIPDELLP